MTLEAKNITLAGKMGLIERIKQLQGEHAAKDAAEKAAKDATAEKERTERETKEAERRRFVTQQTEKILKESGVLENLRQIDQKLLRKFSHQLYYFPEQGRASLEWGWGNGLIISVKGFLDQGFQECTIYSISAEVDPDEEVLTINGGVKSVFGQNDWRDLKRVEDALFEAYMNPKYYHCDPPGSYAVGDGGSR